VKRTLLFGVVLSFIFAFNGCTEKAKQEFGGADEGWNMFQKNPSHTGYVSENTIAANIVLEWKTVLNRDIVDDNAYYSPAVDGNRVYLRAKGHIYALDINDGAVIWRHELVPTGLEGRFTTPALTDESIYMIRNVLQSGGWAGYLCAFSYEGKLRWEHGVSSYIGGNPVVKNGVVYFASGDGDIYAVDGKKNILLWQFAMGEPSHSSPAISNDTVYIGGQDHVFRAIDRNNGRLRWKYQTGYSINSSPAVSGGTVYFGSFDRYFYALDAVNGELKWKFKFDAEERIHDCPAIGKGVVYFSSDRGTLYSLDAQTGELRWKQRIGSHGYLSSPKISAIRIINHS
jgi:outer membrane protein assembly factor BamB